MIEAMATVEGNHLVLKYTYPGTKHVQEVNCNNVEDAKRLVYFWNRLYIVDKMRSWLHQRRRALAFSPYNEKHRAVEELLSLMEAYQFLALHQVCKILAAQREKIMGIAPGVQSKHYGFYANTILPILEFCDEMKGSVSE